MSYVIEIVPGETLFRELNVKNEDGTTVDVSSATKSVTATEGISAADFTITDGDSNYILKLRADADRTSAWPTGQHKVRVWLDWGDLADIENEVIFEARVVVREAF